MRVLLVEDDSDDAEFLRQSLLRHNARSINIIRKDRISEAVTALKAERFDVVLLDLHLPDASGAECVEELRRVDALVPIVVLSGHGDEDYAVEILNVPLVVILGHDSCGAVKATVSALDKGDVPPGFIRDVVERVTPSVLMGRSEGLTHPDELEARHVVETAKLLMQRSRIIADRVEAGRCAIVGVTYTLSDGRVKLHKHIGDIGVTVD